MNFESKYPVIGMCHLQPFPVDYKYDGASIKKIIENAKDNIIALQDGGVDAIIFSNEYSMPYTQKVKGTTIAVFTSVINQVKSIISVPFGIDCMYDLMASIDIAVAVDADFVRGIAFGNYNNGIYNFSFDSKEILNHYKKLKSKKLQLWCSVYPESIEQLNQNNDFSLSQYLNDIQQNISPDVLCIHSRTLLSNTYKQMNYPDLKVYVDGGCNDKNISQLQKKSNGMIIGNFLKFNHDFFNNVDKNEVVKIIKSITR